MFKIVFLVLLVFFHVNGGSVDIKNKTTKPDQKCPDGYVRYTDSCYNFYTEQFSWPEALVFCQTFQHSLVSLRTADQFDYLTAHIQTISGKSTPTTKATPSYNRGSSYIKAVTRTSVSTGGYPGNGFWTSGTSAEVPGQWEWALTKQKIDFSKFNSSDPSGPMDIFTGYRALSGCLALTKSSGYKVGRMDCKSTLHFICERRD